MAQEIINTGAAANDGTGDPLRTAFIKTDNNFDQIWAAGPVGSNVRIAGNTITTLQVNQDLVLAPNGAANIRLNNNTIPGANNTWYLGSATNRWRGMYVGAAGLDVTGNITAAYVTANNDLTVNGNLIVDGDVIQIGNIITDAKTIQLANTAATDAQANGSGITVGASDDVATLLYNSTNNEWRMNIGANISGNVSANYFVGNGSLLTGIATSYGNANVADFLPTYGGNLLANTVEFTGELLVARRIVVGTLPSGNIEIVDDTSGNGPALKTPGGSGLDLLIEPSGNLYLTADGGEVIVSDQTPSVNSATGALRIFGGIGVNGNVNAGENIAAVGNITANYFVGNGSLLTGIATSYGNANVADYLPTYTGDITANNITISTTIRVGTLGSGNLEIVGDSQGLGPAIKTPGGSGLDMVIEPSGNLYLNADGGEVIVSDQTPSVDANSGALKVLGGIGVNGNINAGGNIAAAGWTGNLIPAANAVYSLGNATNYWSNLWVANNTIYIGGVPLGIGAGNVLTVNGEAVLSNDSNSSITTTGNITANSFIGDGSQLTNLPFDASQIENGTSNVAIAAANGNVTVTADSTQTWTFGTNGTLTVPATNVVPAMISTQTTLASEKGFDLSITAGNTNGCSVSGGDLYLSAGVGYNGISHGAGNVNIVTGDRYGNIDGNIWRFDSSGALTLPMSGVKIKDTVGNSIAFGLNAGFSLQGTEAVAIGSLAGNNRQGNNSVAIGNTAGAGGSVSTNYVSGAESPSTTLVVVSTTGIGPGMIITGTGFFGNITVVTVTNSTTLEISTSAGFTPSGTLTFTGSQGDEAVAIGQGAGSTNQGSGAVAVGGLAGYNLQGDNAVAIGGLAGNNSQGTQAVAVGLFAGQEDQGQFSVAIGGGAGQQTQGEESVAIGSGAGSTAQGNAAVAIGGSAGAANQRINSVAIGASAGASTQGEYSVAIGSSAGFTNQGNNSIILNATGAALDQTTANTFTVAPVRNDVANTAEVVFYNATSKEITYGNTVSVAGNVTAGNLISPSAEVDYLAVGVSIFNKSDTVQDGVVITTTGGAKNTIELVPNGGNSTIKLTAEVITATGNVTANNVSTGNVTAARLQNDGNLEIRSNVAGTVKVWTFDAIGDLNLARNISGSGNINIGNVNLGGFLGDGNITSDGNITVKSGEFSVTFDNTGNITGTSANVTLVAGEFSATFDNTGLLTAPVVKTTAVLYSALPLANAVGAGARAFVTDGNTNVFASTVVGGAGNAVPVYSDGTDWRVG